MISPADPSAKANSTASSKVRPMQMSVWYRAKAMCSYPAPRSMSLTMSGPAIENGPGRNAPGRCLHGRPRGQSSLLEARPHAPTDYLRDGATRSSLARRPGRARAGCCAGQVPVDKKHGAEAREHVLVGTAQIVALHVGH